MTRLDFEAFWRDRGAAQGLKNLGNAAAGTQSKFQKLSGTTSGFGSLTGLAFKAAGAAAVGYGLKVASGNEQARISFTTMLGSAQKADVFLKQLQQFAATTPFEFPELQTAASSLISAGVNANKVIPIMRTLGDVTSGMGTGAQGVQRATVALQQMNAAGKITAEDLNQLRDAGIPVYDLLAAATHKSKEEVAGLAQQGKLGRKELEQLMTALESGRGLERFNGLMEQQSKSLAGMVSTLKDVSGQMLAGWLTPLFPAIKASIGAFADMGSGARNTIAIIAGGTAVMAVSASGALKLAAAFRTLGLSAAAAKTAVGGVGAVLGIASVAFGIYASEHAKAKARTEEFTQALEGEEDAVKKASAAVAAKQLQDMGALQASEELGLSMDDVIAAALGQEGALARIQPLLDAYVEAGVDGSIADQDRAEAAGNLSDSLKTVSGAHSDATSQSKQLSEATAAGEKAMGGMEKKTISAKDALKQWRTEMFKSAHAALDLAGSQDAVEQAVDDATQAVKDNGRTLNINTEKGRENRAALRNLASASLTYREKLVEQGRSQKQITQATRDGREEFIRVARRMGLTRDEAGRLANKYGLVEDKTKDAARATRGYDRDINALNSKRINLVANYKATATKAAVEFFKTVPGSQASGFSQLPRGGPTKVRSLDSMIGAPASPPPGVAQGGPTMGASSFKVSTPGLDRARRMGQAWDDVAAAAYSPVAGAGLRAIGKAGQNALDLLGASAAPGGSVGTYSAGMAATIARLRAAGARSFTTYPGHHPSAAKARDVTPHNWRIANTARASSGVWYVIYQMRIASKNHGNTWRQYNPTNHNGDWQHRRHVHVAWYDKGGDLKPGWTMAYNGTGRNERVTPAGGGGNTYIINAPNYVGDKADLVKALTDLDRQGRLAVVKR